MTGSPIFSSFDGTLAWDTAQSSCSASLCWAKRIQRCNTLCLKASILQAPSDAVWRRVVIVLSVTVLGKTDPIGNPKPLTAAGGQQATPQVRTLHCGPSFSPGIGVLLSDRSPETSTPMRVVQEALGAKVLVELRKSVSSTSGV